MKMEPKLIKRCKEEHDKEDADMCGICVRIYIEKYNAWAKDNNKPLIKVGFTADSLVGWGFETK